MESLGGDFAPGQKLRWKVDTGEESRSPDLGSGNLPLCGKLMPLSPHFIDGPFPGVERLLPGRTLPGRGRHRQCVNILHF